MYAKIMTDSNRPTARNIDKQVRDRKGHLIASTPTKAIIEALNNALLAIRARHEEVPNVVLVVGTSSTKKYGHFQAKAWQGKAPHEIMISGESLSRGAVDVLGTLLHECAHALAENTGVKDTSRQGRYHNAEFKRLANLLGIQVEQLPGIGWSDTHVPVETQKVYRRELSELSRALKAYRIPDPAKVKALPNTIKIACDCRSITVPLGFYKKGSVSCDECGQPFEADEDQLATFVKLGLLEAA
jgi:hypothetical protein